MERKFTYNEIVKALECCKNANCCRCPFDGETGCVHECAEVTLDLINRQKAEIEELTKLLRSRHRAIEHLEGVIVSLPDRVRAEAIKEFAERLKANMSNIARMEYGGYTYFCVGYGVIDNLVKEMTEEGTE